jgi:acyl carrier protein
MNDVNDLIGLVREQLGLPLTAEDADRGLDEIPGWDSVHVLWLITVLERDTGSRISLPELLEATSLQSIFDLAVK